MRVGHRVHSCFNVEVLVKAWVISRGDLTAGEEQKECKSVIAKHRVDGALSEAILSAVLELFAARAFCSRAECWARTMLFFCVLMNVFELAAGRCLLLTAC